MNICPVATESYLYPLRPAVTQKEEYSHITFMERIPEMRVVPTFVESRQSNIDTPNNNILSFVSCGVIDSQRKIGKDQESIK